MTDTAGMAAAPPPPSAPSDIGLAIAGIARQIRREDFGTGPLASVRRNAPGAVLGQPAFHRLTADLPEEWLRGDAPVRWATLVHAMAIGASLGETPPEKPAG